MDAWRQFELLVSRIEASLAPSGAAVLSPDRIPDLVTGQLREVDASIRMQVGTTPILITVECRDRSTVQDDTWIEQLAKKKEKIGASATIAVSSRGFTGPAKISASHYGIQLRTLTETSGTDSTDWADGVIVRVEFREWRFTRITLLLKDAPVATSLALLDAKIQKHGHETAIAFRASDKKPLILGEIGGHFVQHGMYPPLPGIRPFGTVAPNDGEYMVPTDQGDYRLANVELEVEVTTIIEPTPLRTLFDYIDLAGPLYRVAEYQFSSPIASLNVGVVSAAQNGAL